ncbi:MAG: GyrI-like domain-containing protein [Rhizobiales bacterium]|nr:GyrI-like domain-containing protein [Hyphomicrobiales bacterium]
MIRSRLLRLGLVVLAPALAFAPAATLAQAPPATAPATTTPPATTPPTTSAPSDTTPAAPTPDKPDQTAPTTAAPATPTPTPPPASATAPASPPATQTADPFGEEITLTPKTVLIYTGNATWDSAFESLIDAFKAVSSLLDKQGIKPAGNPMIVYTSTDDNGFVFQAEMPVDQEPKNLPKNMSMGKSPEGKALKFVHRGSYDNMDNTYEAITNHLDDKKLEAKDLFIEEYTTDPLKTAEDKLVINVYVPLK